jgi:hypothetical protein
MSSTLLRTLFLASFILSAGAFTTTSRNFIGIRSFNNVESSLKQSSTVLFAKKGSTESKGFSPKKVKVVKVEEEETSAVSSSTGIETTTTVQPFDGETDADAIFKKYGIKDGESNKTKTATKKKKSKKSKKGEPEESPFGQSVLAGIPAETQMKIDNTLVAAVSFSLGFVVLSGISISLGAYTVVFPETKIPEWLDGLITNFLSPAFTPALGIFFFFSTTFGLFKFAQISSDQTVYKEEVTRDL